MSEAPFSIDYPVSAAQAAAMIIGKVTSQPALDAARLSFDCWRCGALSAVPMEGIWENDPPNSIPTTSWSVSKRSGGGKAKIPTPAYPLIETSCSFWFQSPTPLVGSQVSSGLPMDGLVPGIFAQNAASAAPAPVSPFHRRIGRLFQTIGHSWLTGLSWLNLCVWFWVFIVFAVFPHMPLDCYLLVLSGSAMLDGTTRIVSQ